MDKDLHAVLLQYVCRDVHAINNLDINNSGPEVLCDTDEGNCEQKIDMAEHKNFMFSVTCNSNKN